MPLRRLLTGHGPEVTRHAELVRSRIVEHAARSDRIVHVLRDGPGTAYGIARHLWSPDTVRSQPLLVVWEVLGHLDLLLDAGVVREDVTDNGSEHGVAYFALTHDNDPPEGGGRPARATQQSH
jgi:hypothetical protein